MSIPFERSFASCNKSKYWSIINKVNPTEVYNKSHQKYWFHCFKCNHEFCITPAHVNEGKWCSYCNSGKLCEDMNCLFCLYKSFASNIYSMNWDNNKNGNIKPRHITRSCGKYYYFICQYGHSFKQKINYIANGKWCSICCNSKRLCLNNECLKCNNNSFASNPKSLYWDYTKNILIPRQVFKANNNKFWFICNNCNHSFDIALNHVNDGKWCKYCYGNDLCADDKCEFCLHKSFASCDKSIYWLIELNEGILPRQVCKKSGKKYWFKCDNCTNIFNIYLPDVSEGHWCSLCINKTEKQLYNILVSIYPTIISQFIPEWIKPKRFDFCIPELKIIIELDGPQHFRQVSNWISPKKQLENDIYKEKCANNYGYSIIRLLQEDVFNDTNNWLIKIQNNIQYIIDNPDVIHNIYISTNNEYENYL